MIRFTYEGRPFSEAGLRRLDGGHSVEVISG